MQQDERRAGRARPGEGADDSACRLGRLQRLALEPFVEVIGRAHRHELAEIVKARLAQAAHVSAESRQSQQVPRMKRGRVGRRHRKERFHRAGHVVHPTPVLLVGFGVAQRVTGELAPVLVVIVPLGEVVAVGERRQRRFERQDVQAVARQVELADDLGSQQAHHVREHREAKAGKDFFAHGCPADALATLEHQHSLSRAGKIGRADQSVVPAADHDRVVARAHARLRSGSKNGRGTTCALARLRRCSTVTSSSICVPDAAQRDWRCASAMYRLSSGDQPPLVA